MKAFIFTLIISLLSIRYGYVTSTMTYKNGDSCRVNIRIIDENKDTIIWYKPASSAPQIRQTIKLK